MTTRGWRTPEILGDKRKETAAAFWDRANAYFTTCGITVRRVLTDNRSSCRSTVFAAALGHDIKHKRTRPYRPQTNGKGRTVEPDHTRGAGLRPPLPQRVAEFPAFLHFYKHYRRHTALKGASPADRAPNLAGQNI
jgi:transposase InsO family protein